MRKIRKMSDKKKKECYLLYHTLKQTSDTST